MLRTAAGFALRRLAPTPRFSSHGGRSSPGCRDSTRRMCSYGTTDDFKATMATLRNWPWWSRSEVVFGLIAGALMATYRYNVSEKTEEARKEREARKQREEMAKNNIDISLC